MSNALFLGWNEPKPGREAQAGELFTSVINFFANQQEQGNIESFEPVLITSHGGDMNGFFLVKGDSDNLHEIRTSDEFVKLIMQCGYALNGFGVIDAYHGDKLMELMGDWTDMVS